MERTAMRERRLRALRGTAAAAVAVLLAATAHTLSGGSAPVWVMLAATILVSPLAVWLAGRRRSSLRTAAVVTVSQAVFHTLFATLGTADPTAAVTHIHRGPHELASVLGAPVAAHGGHVLTPAMICAHLVAAALTAAVVMRGERVLAAVARGIARIVRLVPGALPTLRRPLAGPRAADLVVVTSLIRSSLSLRGPPIATS